MTHFILGGCNASLTAELERRGDAPPASLLDDGGFAGWRAAGTLSVGAAFVLAGIDAR